MSRAAASSVATVDGCPRARNPSRTGTKDLRSATTNALSFAGAQDRRCAQGDNAKGPRESAALLIRGGEATRHTHTVPILYRRLRQIGGTDLCVMAPEDAGREAGELGRGIFNPALATAGDHVEGG